MNFKLSHIYFYRDKLLLYRAGVDHTLSFTETQQIPTMSKHFGDSGEEKLPFNRQKPRAEPGSMVGGHLPRPVGLGEKERKVDGGR